MNVWRALTRRVRALPPDPRRLTDVLDVAVARADLEHESAGLQWLRDRLGETACNC